MKPIKLARLIVLGEMDRYLLDVEAGWRIHGPSHILTNIDKLLEYLRALNFRVTLQASADLRRLRAEFNSYPPDSKVTPKDEARLRGIMDKLRHTLRAEAQTLGAYVLSEKRLDVRKLVEETEFFLASGTFKKLPRVAQIDIREGGRCIAFELPTAGAFHLLRATEDTLRSYYRVFVRKGKIDKTTWGVLVDRLRAKRRKPKPNETLLNQLDHIRKNFRNPTDHPDMIYDIDGVQDLFSIVVDALNRMAKDLPEPDKWTLSPGMLLPSFKEVAAEPIGEPTAEPVAEPTMGELPAKEGGSE